nr:TPA_asm: hypothetical protein HUJ06_030917 [Nelumbo nucifera]
MALQVVLLLLLCLTTATTSSSSVMSELAKPGCPDKCGNITVPYPFGMGDDPRCYREEFGFQLICNHTFTPPKLFAPGISIREDRKGEEIDYWSTDKVVEVEEVSLQGQLRVYSFMGYSCYNNSSIVSPNTTSFLMNMSDTPYTYSDTHNIFTAIGCDARAYIVSGIASTVWYRGRRFQHGCFSFCEGKNKTLEGTNPGMGYCQTTIPNTRGLKYFSCTLEAVNKNFSSSDFNPCLFSFMADKEWYNFSVADLFGFDFYTKNRGRVPTVMDWSIENESCENVTMRNATTYACGNNSGCHKSPNELGYLCKCLDGYQGNPYLQHGCQDINECSDPTLNDCLPSTICTNTAGSYNCSCPSGTEGDGRRNGSGCIPIPPPPPSQTKFRVIQVCIGIGLGMVLLLASYWLYHVLKKRQIKKRKGIFYKRNGGMLLERQISSKEGNVEKIKVFTVDELAKATDQYNENRILGQGGQGTVYKGMLSDGRIVAIKKSKIVDESQLEQFINEVVILSQINHKNVVKLLGCCLETEVPLLVYEFISGGTLFYNIHYQSEDFLLTWDNRLRIATEVAGAIAYLHLATSIPIYHRDIKSSNILLDDKGRAKVSDFGTSRSIAIDKTHLTTMVQGTFGYLDPEYFQSSQLTEKSDVYSFGVVLVELLTGEEPISFTRPLEGRSIVTYFISAIMGNRLFEILDAQVLKDGRKHELQKVANIAKICLSLNGKERPTMKEVALELEGLRRSEGYSHVE